MSRRTGFLQASNGFFPPVFSMTHLYRDSPSLYSSLSPFSDALSRGEECASSCVDRVDFAVCTGVQSFLCSTFTSSSALVRSTQLGLQTVRNFRQSAPPPDADEIAENVSWRS